MKKMTKKGLGRTDRPAHTVKLSISMSSTVKQMADRIARDEGYDNFSAFVAELIRDAKRRRDATAAPSR